MSEKVDHQKIHKAGDTHILLIGIAEYEYHKYQENFQLEKTPIKDRIGKHAQHWNLSKLDTPLNDIVYVGRSIFRQYNIKSPRFLGKDRATRDNFFAELSKYEWLNTKDTLIIYFSGHGYKDREDSYWLPYDAQLNRPDSWIRFGDLRKAFKKIPARHILVIADACFSGKLGEKFPSQEPVPPFYVQQYSKVSRVALTSGGDEPVNDVECRHGRSVFANTLVEVLKACPGHFIPSRHFRAIQERVNHGNSGTQTPQHFYIPNSTPKNDTSKDTTFGGETILFRRKNHTVYEPNQFGTDTVSYSQSINASPRPTIFNVPGIRNRIFSDSENRINDIHAALSLFGTESAVTLSGMSGVGKTTLAREYAYRFGTRTHYRGVWWISAETEIQIVNSLNKLASLHTEEIPIDDDRISTANAAKQWLETRPPDLPFLVILDNAPDLRTVSKWLPQGTTKAIITSQFTQFSTVSQSIAVSPWDELTTVRFLRERIGRGTESELKSIAKLLDGLPLAAEQTGATLRQLSTMSFQEYESRFLELLERYPDTDNYPISLVAAIQISLDAILDRPEGQAALGILNLCSHLSPDGIELSLLTQCAIRTDVLPYFLSACLKDSIRCGDALSALSSYSIIQVSNERGTGPVIQIHRLTSEVIKSRENHERAINWTDRAVELIMRFFPRSRNHALDSPNVNTGMWALT